MTKIFMVEDESLVALELQHRLLRLGYTVVGKATSGESALAALGLESGGPVAADRSAPDLVLMDIVLEGPLDGVETARVIQSGLNIPVVYLTGHTDIETMERAKSTGPFGFVVKPPDDLSLMSAIEMALSKHNAESRLRHSEERFRTLFVEMLNAFALYEIVGGELDAHAADFRILEVNPAFERIMELSKDEVVGHTMREVMPRIEMFWIEMMRQVALTRTSARFQNYFSERAKYFDVVAYSPRPGQVATIFDDISLQKRTEETLTHRTFHDPLTNLPNRALCMDRIRQSLERSKRRGSYLYAVLFLDLDRFKLVNDSLGYVIGDKLLQAVAGKLQRYMRKLDTVARLGGDEFALLLEELQSPAEAILVAKRIRKDFEIPFEIDGHLIYTSTSIGIVLGPTGYEQPEELLQNAAIAMNLARQAGGRRFTVFKWSMRDRAAWVMDVESSLRHALTHGEFEMHYQPIFSLDTLTLSGFEALIRWRKSGLLVPPGEFIPISEETGLILPIGAWVINQVCSVLADWQRRFSLKGLTVALNLSAKQFSQPDLVRQVAAVIKERGLDPALLKLEITESMVMDNPHTATLKLRGLKELGLGLSIDDFGTGYSSLSYLQRFPLDTLKIDRSFVMSMDKQENLVIVKSVINLAHNLGLEVVAEGIETEEQLAQLTELACEKGQGYYFSRPVPKDMAEAMIIQALRHASS